MTFFASSDPRFSSTEHSERVEIPLSLLDSVQITPTTLAELGLVAEVLNESFHQFQPWNTWLSPLMTRGIRNDLHHRFLHTPPPYTCLLAYLETQTSRTLIGTVELSRPKHHFRGHSYLYLANLAVRSEFRRRGVAKQLLTACESIARESEASGLYLHVLANNQAAQKLYESFGFITQPMFNFLGRNISLPSRRLLLSKAFQAFPSFDR